MTNTYKTNALIVKRMNLGESDRIITALSPDYGKIRFVAKGIRKIKSKYGGKVEPFYETNLLLARGKNLDILSNAEIVEIFLSSKPSLEELKTANFIGEIVDRIIPDNQPDPELYYLAKKSLKLLANPVFAKLYFEAQFYRHSGVFPHLSDCVRCQAEGPSHFSLQANGALCMNCRKHFADAVSVRKETLKFWQDLSKSDIRNFSMPATEIFNETVSLSDRYLKTMTTHKFKSALI